MTIRTNLADISDRLARLDTDAVAMNVLATRAEAIAQAVREALSHSPGSDHQYPWLETGALRDSIATELGDNEALVASTSDVAAYQEHGTAAVPPRPFLAPVAAGLAEPTADAVGAAVAAAIAGRAPDATP